MSEVTAEDVANSLAASIDEGGRAKEMSGALTTVSGYEASQVNATMTSGQLLTTWCFKTKDDGNVYYISMEGDEEALSEMTPYIEGTWSETKL